MILSSQPAGEARYDGYTVTLNGLPADVLQCRVSAMPYNTPWPGHQRPLDQTELAGFVLVRSNDPVQVRVETRDAVTDPVVRPRTRGIGVSVRDRTASFVLPGPGQYTFEPSGPHHALHLFVSPEEPVPEAPDMLVYGPGIHEIGVVELHSGQTVVLEAGAVVYGSFEAYGAENVTITGNGILDGSREIRTDDTLLVPVTFLTGDDPIFIDHEEALRAYLKEHQVLRGCIRFYQCRHVTVRGITCRDSSTFTIVPAACEDVLIDDVKIIGNWRYNSDGIDLFNSSRCVIRNSFLRCFDDCMVIKGMRGWHLRNNEQILVEHCVIWCDWGRALEIGAETCAPAYRNITFRDCDVIHGAHVNLDLQHHNHAVLHDILFEDIRIEYSRYHLPSVYQHDMAAPYDPPADFEQPVPFGIFVVNSGLFCEDYRPGSVHDVTFRDIRMLCDPGVPQPKPAFRGLDDAHDIRGVRIENLTLNGRKLTTPEEACIRTNGFVRDLTVE